MKLTRLLLAVIASLVAVGLCQNAGNCTEATVTLRRIGDGLNTPVLLKSAIAPNGREFLFIGQQTGEIVMWDITDFNASSIPPNPNFEPFVDLADSIITLNERNENETRGLLGLAFHREFQRNGLFYVFYSATPSTGNVSAEDPQSCVNRRNSGDLDCTGEQPVSHENKLEEWKWVNGTATMIRTLLIINHPFTSNNGLDALLYDNEKDWLFLATGDGGCFRDPFHNAQNPDSLLGKLLHFNISANNASCDTPVNTFSGLSASCADFADSVNLWAWGFRDPRGLTLELDDLSMKHLIIADDGEQHKEIDIFTAKNENFGWHTIDGFTCVDRSAELCPESNPENGTTVAPAAVLNATSETSSEYGSEYNEADQRELVGGIQFMGSDITCLNQAYLFATYFNGSNMWFIFPADYQNQTFDSAECSTPNYNFTFSGLPVNRVVLSVENGPSGADEYTISQNVRSMGTTVRNDMIFVGTASTLRGDGTLWMVAPRSGGSSGGGDNSGEGDNSNP